MHALFDSQAPAIVKATANLADPLPLSLRLPTNPDRQVRVYLMTKLEDLAGVV